MIENIEVAVVAINNYGDNRSFSQTWEPKPNATLSERDAVRLHDSYMRNLEDSPVFHGEAGDETIVAWTILTCVNLDNGMAVFVG